MKNSSTWSTGGREMDNLPLWWASLGTVIIFLVLLILNWTVRKTSFMSDAPDEANWRDLRVWATVLIFIQLAIYFVFS